MSNPIISVIVPVYNESKTINHVFSRVAKNQLVRQIILVDDCSSDGSRQVIDQIEKEYRNRDHPPFITCLYHEKNMGKGQAISTAIKHVSSPITVIQDADLELNPDEYSSLVKPILLGKTKVVYGTRFLRMIQHQTSSGWLFANRLLTLVTNLILNLRITDMETCYKMMSTDVIKALSIESSRFDVEPEITAKLSKKHFKIYEVPISYFPRTGKMGKKMRWHDGIHAIIALIKFRFFRK